ncbi:MAG: radical SAM family heme chaperone HemW, partial [Anaerolineaceae bacterium]
MFGIYLHIPFCLRRCKYCDFITYAGKEELMPSYKSALIRELRHQARKIHGLPARADTVFFGGGTPSLMRAEWIREILDCARGEFRLASGAEISLEANPGTLAPGDFSSLLEAGVNRISIGVQSFDEGELALLGRIHGPDQAVEAVREARREGFRNISIDLMFSLPGQSLARWKENLYEALSLQPDHLSLYSLILEPGTRLFEEVRQGVLQPAEDELAAEMYEL